MNIFDSYEAGVLSLHGETLFKLQASVWNLRKSKFWLEIFKICLNSNVVEHNKNWCHFYNFEAPEGTKRHLPLPDEVRAGADPSVVG